MYFNPDGALLQATLACELSVFQEQYGNTADEWRTEYEPYEPTSSYVSITDRDGVPVAVSRLVRPGAPGLKTLVDVGLPPWGVNGERSVRAAGVDPARTWDVATIGVRRGAGRAGYLTMALLHGLVLTSRANRVEYITMILDQRARRLLHAMGLPNNILPGTRPAPYAGLPQAVPAWSNIAVMLDQQRELNPEGYRLVALGVGLDDMAVPPVSEFSLERVPAVAGGKSSNRPGAILEVA
jgi:hypothetical protein